MDIVTERFCIEHDGRYVLETEAEGANLASGILALDDGSAEGQHLASAIRLAGNPLTVRSDSVGLHAGEPCYLILAQTGIAGRAATARLIKLPNGHVTTESRTPSLEPTNLLCDRFSLHWKLDGAALLLSIDTDLPDEGELMVSVSRYFRTETGDEYAIPYLDTREPVSRWRDTRRIPLDAERWRASLEEFASGLRATGKRVGAITDRVDIRALLHVNQRDPRFGGRGNPNLSGAATSRRGAWVLVEAEETFDHPLE